MILGHTCFQTFANALVRTSLFITKPLAGTTNYLTEFNTDHLVEQDDFAIGEYLGLTDHLVGVYQARQQYHFAGPWAGRVVES